MSLKKVFITATLLTSCLLAGCEKKNNYFKDYSFTAEASSEQYEKINKGIDSSANAVSKVTRTFKAYRKYNLTSYSGTEETATEILEDSNNKNLLIFESSISVDTSMKEKGLELKEKSKQVRQEWDTGVGYAIIATETTSNKVTSNNTQAYELSSTISSADSKKNRIRTLMKLTDNDRKVINIYNDVYLNKDGSFTYIKENEVTKKVTPVDLGKSSKEYVKQTRKQTVYTINKDYHFTSYYEYSEESTNRDPDTNEWYDSVKVVSYNYTSLQFEYGTRGKADVKELTNKVVAKKDLVVRQDILAYETTAAYAAGSYYIPDGTPETQKTANISNRKELDNGYEYTFTSELYTGSNYSSDYPRAQRFELAITSIGKNCQVKTDTYPIKFSNNVINTSWKIDDGYYSLINYADTTYYVNEMVTTTVYFTFVIEFANQKVTVKSIDTRGSAY